MDFPSYFQHARTPFPSSNVPSITSETRSLKTSARTLPTQRWEFRFSGHTVAYNCNTGQNDTLAFTAEFAASAKGGFTIFDYKPNPMFLMADGLNISLINAASAQDDEVVIGSPTTSADPTSSIVAGKMLRFATADKVYMITKVVDLGIVGSNRQYRVTLNTGIFQDQSAGTQIIADSTLRIKLRLDGDIISGQSPNIQFNKTVFQFRMIEVI